MATILTKPVIRKTTATVFEKSQRRNVLVHLLPTARIGVRLAGTRDIYAVDAETLYSFAVKQHAQDVERLARQINKSEQCGIRSARAKARKEMAGKLRV